MHLELRVGAMAAEGRGRGCDGRARSARGQVGQALRPEAPEGGGRVSHGGLREYLAPANFLLGPGRRHGAHGPGDPRESRR